jgi:hypothetical protein
MMWVLVGIACCELFVVHLLVALWSRAGALILTALTLGSIIWLVTAIGAMRTRPILIGEGVLVMRVGRLKRATVPLCNIEGVVQSWDRELLKRRSTLNLALVAYPNIVIALRDPLPGRRAVRHIAHRLDDPTAFLAALEALGPQYDRRSARPARP